VASSLTVFFHETFRSYDINTVKCQSLFLFDLPRTITEKRIKRFKDGLVSVTTLKFMSV